MTNKYLIIHLLSALALLFLPSCSPEVDYNRPVVLPKDPPKQRYFVGEKKMINTFGTQGQTATLHPELPLVFNYNGSLMQNTPHNRDQAKAISEAMRSTALAGKHFSFDIQGSNITLNHKESLLNLLSASGVRLRNFEVTSGNTKSTTLLENTLKNRTQRNETVVIMSEMN